MDTRRSINTRIWSDQWVEKLKPDEKLVWIYLLTNRDTNLLGIYEISLGRISYETGLTAIRVETIMKGFETVRKAFYFSGTVFLPNWLKNQSMNPNMMKYAKKLYDGLHNDLISKLKDNGFEGFESITKGLPKGSVIEIEIESEKESEKEKPEWAVSFTNYHSEIIYPMSTAEFGKLWDRWLHYRSELGIRAFKKTGEQSAVNSLFKMCGGDINIAEEIVETSIRNNWQGLFAIKQQPKSKQQPGQLNFPA